MQTNSYKGNFVKDCTSPIYNSYLQLLLQNLNVTEVLNDINIENIEDVDTKIICRTISHSIEALKLHLNVTQDNIIL